MLKTTTERVFQTISSKDKGKHNMSINKWYKSIIWIRLIITTLGFLLITFCICLIIYGSNSTSIDIALGILAGISALFALGQWFFPSSPIQPEVTHLPRAFELVRRSFRMGDDAAANFTYITTPIQNAYNAAMQVLLDSSNGTSNKRGILIIGEANAGKTRLAFEVLMQALHNWPVLRWRPDYTIDRVPKETFLSGKRLVIFIDDLQDYVHTQMKDINGNVLTVDPSAAILVSLLEILRQNVRHVVVVATCRLEDEARVRAELDQFFTELMVIPLQRFNVDDQDPEVAGIVADFQRHGATYIKDWDGTLGSLVLGLSKKNSEYLKIQNDPAATVLHAMKLLTLAGITVHTEWRIKKVCADVFGEKVLQESIKTWQATVDQLTRLQFVTEDEDDSKISLAIRKDTYFDKVITNYPPPNRPHRLIHDFKQLQDVLTTLRDFEGLVILSIKFNNLNRHEEALATCDRVLALDPNFTVIWPLKGITLEYLKRHEEALIAFDHGLTLDPNNPDGWFGKASTLNHLKRYDEALIAFDRRLAFDPKNAVVWFRKGLILPYLKRYNEAIAAFDRSLALDPNNATVWVFKGELLATLKHTEEAVAVFDHALALDPNNTNVQSLKRSLLRELGLEEDK